MQGKLLDLFLYCIPAIIVGVTAYWFFKQFINNENKRRQFLLKKDAKAKALPNRLQAYERLALFLERIKPSKLLVRVNPIGGDKNQYESLLIQNIEQEFNHNLSQQIYVTQNCWNLLVTSKNATIQLIRNACMNDKVDNANKLRDVILNDLLDKHAPSETALVFIKEELKSLW